MGLSRRDAWTLSLLLAATLALATWQTCRLRPRPFAIERLQPPAPLPRIDMNRASLSELEALPDVGPKLAAALIRHRPFRTLDDLARVPGLGPRGIDRLAPRVTFGPP